jgi:hypothetical protein
MRKPYGITTEQAGNARPRPSDQAVGAMVTVLERPQQESGDISVCLRDHIDHDLAMVSTLRPFAKSREQNEPSDPLLYTAPPIELAEDVRHS